MKPLEHITVGMKVIGSYTEDEEDVDYTGEVYSVYDRTATIKRDDKITGGGDNIPGYGAGWAIEKIGRMWSCDGDEGCLFQQKTTWKELIGE